MHDFQLYPVLLTEQQDLVWHGHASRALEEHEGSQIT